MIGIITNHMLGRAISVVHEAQRHSRVMKLHHAVFYAEPSLILPLINMTGNRLDVERITVMRNLTTLADFWDVKGITLCQTPGPWISDVEVIVEQEKQTVRLMDARPRTFKDKTWPDAAGRIPAGMVTALNTELLSFQIVERNDVSYFQMGIGFAMPAEVLSANMGGV